MKPLLLIALGLGAVGVGVYVYRRRQAASSSGGMSLCEASCVAAARAAGVTGDLSALCKKSCGIVDTLKKYAQTGVNTVGGALSDAFGGETPPFCSTCCPAGSSPSFSDRPFGDQNLTGTQTAIRDQRVTDTNSGYSVWGAVCIDDATGAIIGTLTNQFNPYTAPSFEAPPPSSLVSSPTGATKVGATAIAGGTATSSTTADGGVLVTTREQSAACVSCRDSIAKYGSYMFLSGDPCKSVCT